MKAEDTVMEDQRIRDVMAEAMDEGHEYGDDGKPLPEKCVAKAQAKITWDKAIREVVKWTERECGFDWSEEEEQLKKWGIADRFILLPMGYMLKDIKEVKKVRKVVCDKCGSEEDIEVANAKGWSYQQKKDLCPLHIKEYVALEKALSAQMYEELDKWLATKVSES